MDKIKQALNQMFEKHRIVFWYDSKKELRDDYESLEMSCIEKIELNNNEFGVKYKILRELPDQKFLLYHEGEKPSDLDNWLLDVELASGEFRTDQAAIWLNELGLGFEFTEIAKEHVDFFKASKRREMLVKILTPEDTLSKVRLKMISVCAGSEPRLDDILENLLLELSLKKDEKIKLIERCGLDSFLYSQVQKHYSYKSETPGIRDFSIELFKSCYAIGLGETANLGDDAFVFLKRWKDNIRQQKAFEVLSNECAEILNIEKDLELRDILSLDAIDFFELIDRKILSALVTGVAERTFSTGDRENLIRQRKLSHWYENYRHLYKAIDYGARFLQAQEEAELDVISMPDGITKYTKFWFLLDQLYRKFIFHSRKSGQITMLNSLSDKIENHYSNNYLLKVNNNWQSVVDSCDKWGVMSINTQRDFYKKFVTPFLKKKLKVFVIISDALRYEAGEELLRKIRYEDRFHAELCPALSILPSYTQLGMAALLPNKELRFADNDTGEIIVDGISSKGTENRSKILREATDGRGMAIRSDALMRLNKDDSRGLIREHDVVYVYHNMIDATGDKKDSEERVFEAVEDTFEELVKLIKKLASANASNILVTADHGFIYQNRPIEESDFLSNDNIKDDVLYRDRRFLLGKNLTDNKSMKLFSAKEIGLEGDMDIQIPKSINRIRLKGSGSRFVHGGASMQEVIIPVIQINKKRKSDVSRVGVDILGGSTSVITSGQFSVAFYQTQIVEDKVQPRKLRAGIYSKENKLISDCHEIDFDMTSKNPRDREIKMRFVLSREADDLNEQEVFLRLDEKLVGTSHYKEYKSARYTIRRSFTSDFDF